MAQAIYRIPLTNIAQSFLIDLNGVAYTVLCRYNTELQSWLIDMSYAESGQVIFTALPLVTGTDLLAQYGHLGIEGSLIVYTDGDEDAPPTESNLGTASNLYYVTSQ